MAASCTLRMKRLVNLWNAAAVILLVSIGGSAAQPKSGEPAAQPKTILFIDSFGPNFQQGILARVWPFLAGDLGARAAKRTMR